MELSRRETHSISVAGGYDEEMRDIAPATEIEVPSFVAEAYTKTLNFLYNLHKRIDNVEQWVTLEEEDQLPIKAQVEKLQKNSQEMETDIKAYTDNVEAYNYQKYVYLREMCATFENQVDLRFAFVKGDQDHIKRAVETLSIRQGELLSEQKRTPKKWKLPSRNMRRSLRKKPGRGGTWRRSCRSWRRKRRKGSRQLKKKRNSELRKQRQRR